LIASGVQVIPTGSSVFSKSEQAFCYFEMYTQDASAGATIRLRVVDRKTGAEKWDGGAANVEAQAGGRESIPVGLSVPIAAIPSGSYRLEVTATDRAGGTARQTADFEIK
jgi:hypothetical protein